MCAYWAILYCILFVLPSRLRLDCCLLVQNIDFLTYAAGNISRRDSSRWTNLQEMTQVLKFDDTDFVKSCYTVYPLEFVVRLLFT